MEELSAGAEFAGYRIERVVGRGGMGVVYCATDLTLDRHVALKLIAASLAGNAEFRRRFTIESRVAASLDHPNVIPIYQAGEVDGVMFLTMRYVEGHDLRSLVADGSRLPPERAVGIAVQVGAALDAAHEAGLVHRDVKPANVLLTARDHAYLTDFGLTKRLAPDHEVTGTGRLLGTLNFVAPEQIRGGQIGPHTDVYALGGTLFQLLTGRVPFPLDTEEGKLWAHLSEPPPSASAVCDQVPKAFDDVIRRAMSKRAEDRYPSAGELCDAALAALEARGERRPTAPRTAQVAAPGSPQRRAILTRALLDPFALVLLVAMLAAGLVINFAVVLPVSLAIYGASVARAYFDEDVRRVVARRQADREPREPPEVPAAAPAASSAPVTPEELAAPRSKIDAMLDEALEKEAEIRHTIENVKSPDSDVARELDELGTAIRRTAAHAQILQNELNDTSASAIELRIAQLESVGDPRHARLLATLRRQLSARQAMEEQIRLFYEEMNDTLSELDAVGEELDKTSGFETERLAAEVRDMRQGIRKVDDVLIQASEDEIPLDVVPPPAGNQEA